MPTDLSPRIKAIQKIIGVAATGEYDLATIDQLVSIMQLQPDGNSMQSKKEAIQKKLGFSGTKIDNIFGVNTTTRLEFFVSSSLPDLPPGASMIVSKKGLDLIIQSEVSGEAAYNLKYKNPTWPKSDSGVTIGIGYDLGFETAAGIQGDWANFLSTADINKLKSVAGLKGLDARDALANNVGGVRSVSIPYEAAKEVFYVNSMPGYARSTKSIYPGVAVLPPDAQAALLSIVYNRGTSLSGNRRMEMKNIVALVSSEDLEGIAAEIRSMKRLWTTPDTRGLVIRREKEAVLVENASFFFNPGDIIIV
ncbi:hypothetical protein [Ferruginibacter sp. SUN106]|uniref:hypothetical protein n=1 Tax=Ferruginibacter sp. SUN106 TaxID=2978348 RepID=UPI003D360024